MFDVEIIGRFIIKKVRSNSNLLVVLIIESGSSFDLFLILKQQNHCLDCNHLHRMRLVAVCRSIRIVVEVLIVLVVLVYDYFRTKEEDVFKFVGL